MNYNILLNLKFKSGTRCHLLIKEIRDYIVTYANTGNFSIYFSLNNVGNIKIL